MFQLDDRRGARARGSAAGGSGLEANRRPSTAGAPPKPLPRIVEFDRDIRPMLSDNCFKCHGPDDKQRMANLRLDTPGGTTPGVIVPGERPQPALPADERRQTGPRMPPPSSGLTLTQPQVELIRRWIDQGAKWEKHWSFLAAQRRPPLPAVQRADWPRNPIDRFMLARLEREGLKPSPEADEPP